MQVATKKNKFNNKNNFSSFEPDAALMHYMLYMYYISNGEAVLFACLSSGWATTTGRLLGPKVGNNIISVFSKDTATRYRIGSRIKV